MTRINAVVLALSLAALAGCSTGPSTGGLNHTWYLATVDGKPLPTQADLPDGYQLESEYLVFPGDVRPRSGDQPSGLVTITEAYRAPTLPVQESSARYGYQLDGAELHINLCPMGALCIMQTELVGSIGPTTATLTHYLGGQAKSVYQFVLMPAMPD